MNASKHKVLFLADTSHPAAAVHDHINAITDSDDFEWEVLNPLKNRVIDKYPLEKYAAIGIHYSIKPYNYYYLNKELRQALIKYQGFKFVFLQDEYQDVNAVQDFLSEQKIDALFTLVTPDLIDKAYPDIRLRKLKKISVLTAYVAPSLLNISSPPINNRAIDVSYRARKCDYWLGKLAYEKQHIGAEFVQQVNNRGLILDISMEEQDRLYGDDWISLLTSSRAVLGSESGASIWDFSGQIKNETISYLAKHREASFDEVFDNVLKPYDGHIVYSAISPRVFEAAAAKTAMIMFPGSYSGICKPHYHYIQLEKDFSNLEDVLKKLSDSNYLEYITRNAYNDFILSGKYSSKVLGKLVRDEVVLGIKDKRFDFYVKPSFNGGVLKSYKGLNTLRMITSELLFIAQNVKVIFFSKRYSFKEKANVLLKGFKRYFLYLSSRLCR